MKTRSGREFSPLRLARALAERAAEFVVSEEQVENSEEGARVLVEQELAELVQSAVSRENNREWADEDDAEGHPLSYDTVFSSPLSSAPPSRSPSPWPEDIEGPTTLPPSGFSSPSSRGRAVRSASPGRSKPASSKAKGRGAQRKRKREHRSPSCERSGPGSPVPSAHQAESVPSSHNDKPTTSSTPSTLKGRAARRKRKRHEESLKRLPGDYKIRSSLSEKYKHVESVKTTFDLKTLRAAKGGDIGLRRRIVPVSPALAAYLNKGFKVLQWDGW